MITKYGGEISLMLSSHGNRPYFSLDVPICSPELIRYFTLAHEIAHSLVQAHDAEHELYFSTICQKFLPELSKLTNVGGVHGCP